MVQIKRVYDARRPTDGARILVERLWPRGLRKEAVAADRWMKEVAPSTELRRWFGHREERWEDFRNRYRAELDAHAEAWRTLLDASKEGPVTLLYSAHDPAHNSAAVLRDYLTERSRRRRAARSTARARHVPQRRGRGGPGRRAT